MGIPVDPFQQPIPPALQQDPEVRSYFEFLAKFNHDMWLRSGGGVGVIPEFLIEVANGNVPGHELIGVTGSNNAITLSTEEDIWPPGGVYSFPTAEEQWHVVSDDANDTLAGTGAQVVGINYLDDTFTQRSEDVNLNGVTPVLLSAANGYRHNLTTVIQTGTTGQNQGNITIERASDNAVRGYIPFDVISGGGNRSSQTHYSVPKNKKAVLVGFFPSLNKSSDSILRLQRTNADDGIFVTLYTVAIYQQSTPAPLSAPASAAPEGTDFKVTGVPSASESGIAVIYQILLSDG